MTELAADPFRKVVQNDAVADNSVIPFYLADRKLRIAIARVDDRLFAFDDLCTCSDEQCPLSGGLLRGTTLMCQCHGSWFDITTGAVISGPGTEALNVYDVQEGDGDIRVRIPLHDASRERLRRRSGKTAQPELSLRPIPNWMLLLGFLAAATAVVVFTSWLAHHWNDWFGRVRPRSKPVGPD